MNVYSVHRSFKDVEDAFLRVTTTAAHNVIPNEISGAPPPLPPNELLAYYGKKPTRDHHHYLTLSGMSLRDGWWLQVWRVLVVAPATATVSSSLCCGASPAWRTGWVTQTTPPSYLRLPGRFLRGCLRLQWELAAVGRGARGRTSSDKSFQSAVLGIVKEEGLL